MQQPTSAEPSALPGVGTLVLCAAILFAGYIAAAGL